MSKHYSVAVEYDNGWAATYVVVDNVWWLKPFKRLQGITLGRKVRLPQEIHAALQNNMLLLCHEGVHVIQRRRLGWKYLPVMIFQYVTRLFVKQWIPLEKEAYQWESRGSYDFRLL